MDTNYRLAFKRIKKAIEKANNKYGQCNHELIIWASIISQETGEVNKEAMMYKCNEEFYNLNKNEILKRYEMELLDVAASTINALRSLYSNEMKNETIYKSEC